jgi:FHA domain
VKITRCVPLAGQGVIARFGALVAVTDGRGPDPDPLLSAIAEVAAAAGDGGDLVLMAARAALGCCGQPAWACAGVTEEGGVAVLVHGCAVAVVRVGGGPEVTLTAGDSAIPVSRTFTGASVTVGLVIGDPPAPDPQFWLGGGVVRGGGLAVTVSADVAELAVRDAIDAMAGVPNAGATISSDDWFARRPPADPAVWHPPTLDTPAVSTPAVSTPAIGTQAGAIVGEDDPQAILVDGVLCVGDHFNDPGARACRQCGIGLDQPPRNLQRRQRPPLGVLVLDDGTRFPLDRNYVLGREPTFDSDVIDGRARPLRINDPNGTVSRLHLRISLVGWQVEVSDLGSANGSVLQSPGDERTLAPFAPTTIEPGTRIGIGQRSMQYLAYQGVLP